MIPDGIRGCLGQRMVLLRPDNNNINGRYLLYALQSQAVKEQISWNEGTGSTVSNLRIPILTNLRIPFFPLPEQKAIAHILGALDDKIELNRRMNRTLEAMARAIFKSWFVDFDPVRAKMEGRKPQGMDAATAALFPNRLVDSELGEVPEGWEVASILDTADLLSGGTPKTSEPLYWDGDIPWASAKDVSQCGETFLVETERKITENGLNHSATKIIPAYSSVVVARGATTGRLALFGKDIAMNQTCYGLRSSSGAHFYLYCHFKYFVNTLVNTAHGSVFDTITTRTFQTTNTLIPNIKIQKTFDEIVEPFFLTIFKNQKESRTLAALRDTLLPRLLSGEINPGGA